eukprot:2488379-Rhodomonas_salina.1
MHDAVCRQSVGVAEGLGVVLGQKEVGGKKKTAKVVVHKVSEKGAASSKGIREGDEMVEVAGKKVEGLSVEEVEGLLVGQAGTGVEVKGKRGESGEEYSAELVRRGEVGE